MERDRGFERRGALGSDLLHSSPPPWCWFTSAPRSITRSSAPRARHVFQILDHASIYLLIAGTYTPFTLVSLRGPLGWTIFGVEWALAIAGVIFKSFAVGRF